MLFNDIQTISENLPLKCNLKKQFSEIFDKIDDKSRQIGTFQNTAGAAYANEKKLNIQMLSLFASNSRAPSLKSIQMLSLFESNSNASTLFQI